MSAATITLFLIGFLCLLESVYALAVPERYRRLAARLVESMDPDERYIGMGFAAVTLLVWLIAATGGTWTHRTLWAVGVLLMIITLFAFRPDGIRRLLEGLLLKRSATGIRLLYLVEFTLAVGFIMLAVGGL